ncbi:MAG TPA: serine/threonine-protein kinase, partial [Polyangiaceae bacterium]
VDALSAAHRRKIVHRDLKPENIFLSRPAGNRLQPKVLDFGIAKFEQHAAERLTRDGAVIGSPAYMAPEQLRGDPDVDARVDIWALGVVLYQMITGARPFEGASYHASMWNIIHAEPRSLSEHGVEEPALWSVIQTCLMKDPKARFPDMRAFGAGLARWLMAQGIREDVGNASLTAWLEEAAPTSAAVHSFFPSHAPEPRAAAPAPADPVEQISGTRRIVAVNVPVVSAVRRSVLRYPRATNYLLLVLGTAILAFVGAALLRGAPAEEEELEPAQHARTAPRPSQRRPAPSLRELDASEPRGVLSPLASALAPQEAAPRSESGPGAPAPKRASASKASARRGSVKSELKDPFQ